MMECLVTSSSALQVQLEALSSLFQLVLQLSS